MNQAILALENGWVFRGESIGAPGECVGEVVFNTSMTGYQEILTDPSYTGQIVTMTYPHIGNYGTNPQDAESRQVWTEGLVVRECSQRASSWRSEASLTTYLQEHRVVGIAGIDTRALTEQLRIQGAMQGVISTEDLDAVSLVEKAKSAPSLVGRDLVAQVTCKTAYEWNDDIAGGTPWTASPSAPTRFQVVVYDFGVKYNILRQLTALGCHVTVVPASTSAEDVLSRQPDGVVLSNGPGDPSAVRYAVEASAALVGQVPILGICLGHQILGQALGGTTFKLKFGHHGANHPVKDLKSEEVAITSQNHGFCVDINSLPDDVVELTHVNLNDQTAEGLRHRTAPLFSVQYHPEASPGPHDASYLFGQFIELMERAA